MAELLKLAMEESVELKKKIEETEGLEVAGNEYLIKEVSNMFTDAFVKLEKKYGREEVKRLCFDFLKWVVGERAFEELKRDFDQGMGKEALLRKAMMKYAESDCGLNCRQW